jgi:2-polyprenyl-3-methyl-5-hydroxy-6-metoxy-1,4-benzoquinol methylase
MMSFSTRADLDEYMDDPSRPRDQFEGAWRELAVINRRLGGIRAAARFLPPIPGLRILDVAAGGCDVAEALIIGRSCRIVVLDRNAEGLKLARRSMPVVADALEPPFRDGLFDVVMASLFFHHLTNDECVIVLQHMWRMARRLVIVNDLHRHRVAWISIRVLTALFSNSMMVQHDGPISVRRAFRPPELLDIARRAGVPGRVVRSFPYRLVLVAEKSNDPS